MKFISYDTLATVSASWDAVRFGSKADFDVKFGTIVLNKLFEIEPKAEVVFEIKNVLTDGEIHSAANHVKVFASLFDSVFQLVGPDLEFAEEILKQVGLRHKSAGVDPRFFSAMGEAFLHGIETLMDRPLTRQQRQAWEEVYGAISNDIIRAICE